MRQILIKLVLIFSLINFINFNHAISDTKKIHISNTIHTIKWKNRTLREISSKYFNPASKYNSIDEYEEDIKTWNKHISDWSTLKTGTQIYISYPYSPFLSFQYAQALNKNSNAIYSVFVNYDMEYGTTLEKNPANEVEIKTSDRTPYSLGMKFTRTKTAKNSWNLHVNYSKDVSPKNKQTGEKVSMPFQLESGLHYSHFLNSLIPYAGIDYYTFSTFNTGMVFVGNDLEIYGHEIVFATVGILKSFHHFSIKGDFSMAIFSSSDKKIGQKKFMGQRANFVFKYKFSKIFVPSIFFKYISLDGATSYTKTKFGLGINIKIF